MYVWLGSQDLYTPEDHQSLFTFARRKFAFLLQVPTKLSWTVGISNVWSHVYVASSCLSFYTMCKIPTSSVYSLMILLFPRPSDLSFIAGRSCPLLLLLFRLVGRGRLSPHHGEQTMLCTFTYPVLPAP